MSVMEPNIVTPPTQTPPTTNQTMPPPQEPQPVTPQQPEPSTPIDPVLAESSRSKRKTALLLLLSSALLAIITAGLYSWFIYLPNTPEAVLKKAAENFSSDVSNYTVSGRLDQAGPNDPDFTYTIKTDDSGNLYTDVSASTFVVSPAVSAQRVNGKTFVLFNGFESTQTLASRYGNATGIKGIQEHIAEFVDNSEIYNAQNKWIEIDEFIFDQPINTQVEAKAAAFGESSYTVGEVEVKDGIKTRKYNISVDKSGFKRTLEQLESTIGTPLLSEIFEIYSSSNNFAEQIDMSLWVNLKTKRIHQLSYDGRPFQDATLSINLVSAPDNEITQPEAQKLTDTLSFGVVWSRFFNGRFQSGNSEADKERIADLKGIKTALEIYKAKNGYYPERYEMSVQQESFIRGTMPGADLEVFKDPSDRLIGLNGSQYAYVSSLNSGEEGCGRFSSPCEKYFIATTLDDGTQYQLNSDQ